MTIILSYAIIRIKSPSIFESPQKTVIRFSRKKFLHKCLFKIPLWREIDNASSYFLISNKNFSKIIWGSVTFLWKI